MTLDEVLRGPRVGKGVIKGIYSPIDTAAAINAVPSIKEKLVIE